MQILLQSFCILLHFTYKHLQTPLYIINLKIFVLFLSRLVFFCVLQPVLGSSKFRTRQVWDCNAMFKLSDAACAPFSQNLITIHQQEVPSSRLHFQAEPWQKEEREMKFKLIQQVYRLIIIHANQKLISHSWSLFILAKWFLRGLRQIKVVCFVLRNILSMPLRSLFFFWFNMTKMRSGLSWNVLGALLRRQKNVSSRIDHSWESNRYVIDLCMFRDGTREITFLKRFGENGVL